MAQKINPKRFRLRISQRFSSKWFTRKSKTFKENVSEDFLIRSHISKIFSNSISIVIERRKNIVNVQIITFRHANKNTSPFARNFHFSRNKRPIQDMDNAQIEKFFEEIFSGKKFKIEVIELGSGVLNADIIALQINDEVLLRQKNRNIQFKPILNKILKDLGRRKNEIRGLRIEMSRRTSSSAIASRVKVQMRKLPRQTLRSPIDFTDFRIPTKLRIIGVKIWLLLK